MMANIVTFTLYLCALHLVASLPQPPISPCKLDDAACVNSAAQALLNYILSGVPDANIESSDPLYIDLIEANDKGLYYKYSNSTITGFKDCKISNVRLSPSDSKLDFELHCKAQMAGKYLLKGRLLIIPVEGDGNVRIQGDDLKFVVNAAVKETVEDGVSHLSIKNFKLEVSAEQQVHFEFTNLFNGNKELADGVVKFANANYQEVVKEISPPVFYAIFKKIFKNVNKYLKLVPTSELYLLKN
ncbi:unnamed protein product [Plutella xylostella]|uniref:(diamondback moth) hypothetical protein n=1 Tax=Plutella xylostella TaxID=51655 RepID=A0A8S4G624_PLUXY|nr:unnamed protein product [Plutella xylostella]